MNTKQKKIIIISLAVVAIAAIIFYLVWRKKNTIEAIVEGLDIDDDLKKELINRANLIKEQYKTDEDIKFACDSMRKTFHYCKNKTFVVQAAMFMEAENNYNLSIKFDNTNL